MASLRSRHLNKDSKEENERAMEIFEGRTSQKEEQQVHRHHSRTCLGFKEQQRGESSSRGMSQR